MNGTYDKSADAVYLYLVDDIEAGESKRQIAVEGEGLRPMVILDLDEDGRFLGIEIIGAENSLRQETLASLRRIG